MVPVFTGVSSQDKWKVYSFKEEKENEMSWFLPSGRIQGRCRPVFFFNSNKKKNVLLLR
jgi:hypothetical protein